MHPNPYIAKLKTRSKSHSIFKNYYIVTPVTDAKAILHVKNKQWRHILLDTLSEIELLNIIEYGHLPL